MRFLQKGRNVFSFLLPVLSSIPCVCWWWAVINGSFSQWRGLLAVVKKLLSLLFWLLHVSTVGVGTCQAARRLPDPSFHAVDWTCNSDFVLKPLKLLSFCCCPANRRSSAKEQQESAGLLQSNASWLNYSTPEIMTIIHILLLLFIGVVRHLPLWTVSLCRQAETAAIHF